LFLFFSNARTLNDSKIKNYFIVEPEFGPNVLENVTGLSPDTVQFTGIK
jgi:hypothetical protein